MVLSTVVDRMVGERWAKRISGELDLKPSTSALIYIRSNPKPAFLPESSPGFSLRVVSKSGQSSGMYFPRGTLLGMLPDEMFYNYCRWRADKLADALTKRNIEVDKRYASQFNKYI